ncbi:CHAD domain-containing protein [Dyella caseinilytica]|nr:CHAD domain-containing protein [Dyella caseinilytica]
MALGALASRECRSLQRALARHNDHHGGIHDARRSCRRLRSLLAFMAASLDPQPTAKADKTLRQLTHSFSGLRDAHVAARTARRLAAAHASTITPVLIQQLEERSESLLADALEQDPAWKDRRSKAERIAKLIDALDWQAITPSLAKDALKHSVRRMKKARRVALEQREDEAFHLWRRRTRQLRYQLEFLRRTRHIAGMKKSYTRQYGSRIKQLSLIIDRLGWRQDFQVFLQTLDQLSASVEITALRTTLAKTSSRTAKASAKRAADLQT